MEGLEILFIQGVAVVRGVGLRLCRADQVRALFSVLERWASQYKRHELMIALESISFARTDAVRAALAEALSQRNPDGVRLFWAGGKEGDATFLRFCAALSKVKIRTFRAELEAFAALGVPTYPE